MILDVPTNQQIKYNPEFLEKFIEFWTQYIALLIPAVYIIYDKILGNAFRKKILDSKVWSELKHQDLKDDVGNNTLKHKYDF